MSRSPYYPRKRARVHKAKQKPTSQEASDGRPRSIGPCFICDVDLPIVSYDGLFYVQASLGFLCKAVPPTVCPWQFHLEAGANRQGDTALPLAVVRPEVHPA
jgi:hypothetical protein